MVSDPAEDIKTLDIEIFEKIVRNDPMMMLYKEAKTDEVIKIFRIFSGNYMEICESEDLYDNTEVGIYNKISLINHACILNATLSWVMGDFKRRQVRAFRIIEEDEEVLAAVER